MDNTKFYRLLLSAKNNPDDMMIVISEIMPIINDKSAIQTSEDQYEYKTQIDEDLKSELIERVIRLIKSDGFTNKLANGSINENI